MTIHRFAEILPGQIVVIHAPQGSAFDGSIGKVETIHSTGTIMVRLLSKDNPTHHTIVLPFGRTEIKEVHP